MTRHESPDVSLNTSPAIMKHVIYKEKMKNSLFVFVEIEYGDLYVTHIDDLIVVDVSIGIPVD